MKEAIKILAMVCSTIVLIVLPLSWPVFIIVMFMLCAAGGCTKKDLD